MPVKEKKKIKKIEPSLEKINKKLTPQQERFCRLYTQNDFLFGNATLSYAEAYGYKLDTLSEEAVYEEYEDDDGKIREKKVDDSPYNKAYKVCGVNGNRLLKNASIDARIIVLLNEMMTPEMVDAEIVKTMKQKDDMSAKMAAIREFNKLNGRIIDKSTIKHEGLSLKDLYEAARLEDIAEPKTT